MLTRLELKDLTVFPDAEFAAQLNADLEAEKTRAVQGLGCSSMRVVLHWADEKLDLHTLHVHPDTVARRRPVCKQWCLQKPRLREDVPPLRRGGRGGIPVAAEVVPWLWVL